MYGVVSNLPYLPPSNDVGKYNELRVTHIFTPPIHFPPPIRAITAYSLALAFRMMRIAVCMPDRAKQA